MRVICVVQRQKQEKCDPMRKQEEGNEIRESPVTIRRVSKYELTGANFCGFLFPSYLACDVIIFFCECGSVAGCGQFPLQSDMSHI